MLTVRSLLRNRRPGNRWPLRGPIWWCLLLAACGSSHEVDVDIVDLGLQRPREVCLAPGEVDPYRLVLDAGEFFELAVDQHGADVVVTLLDGDRRTLAEVDGLTGSAGVERLPWVAAEAGEYRVEIDFPGSAAEGCYRIELVALREATVEDRRRADAAQAYLIARSLAEPDERVRAYLRALDRWKTLDDREWQARVLQELGFVHRTRLRRPAKARDYYLEGLEHAGAVGDPVLEALLASNLGDVSELLGDMDAAIAHYQRALELRSRMDDPRLEARTLHDLGYVFAMLGEVHEALDHYQRALGTWHAAGEGLEKARTLHNRGKCYARLGDDRRALDDFERALELRRELGDLEGEISTLSDIGEIYESAGDVDRSLEFFEGALSKSRELGDRQGEALVLVRLGALYGRAGRQAEALGVLERALAAFQDAGDRRYRASALHHLGWHHHHSGNLDAAEDAFREALELARALGARGTAAATRLGLAHVARQRGDTHRAHDHVERAIELIEDLRSEPGSLDLRTAYFAIQQSYYDFYVDLLMELDGAEPDAGWARRAFEMSERARARALLDLLGEGVAEIRRGVDPELLADERRLTRAIRGREYRRAIRRSGTRDEETVASLDRQIERLLRERDRVLAKIRKSSPSFDGLLPAAPLTAEAIQEVVGEDTVLLELDLGDERSFLWWVAGDRFRSFELPGRTAIEESARKAYELTTVSSRRRFERSSREALADLSELLLRPVAGLLENQRLLIVGDGVLQYVPFAALPKPGLGPGREARPLIADHEIVTLPSASALAALRRRREARRPPQGLLAIVADPVFSTSDPRLAGTDGGTRPGSQSPAPGERPAFERLPFTRHEAEAILATVPGGAKRLALLGFDADRERAVGGELAAYRIVHFATHGRLNTARPELSGLVFSLVDPRGRPRDGFLHALEIYELDLAADLVVLSACQTALGREIRGEGLVGLTQGFLSAGAAQVVVSLWNVNDRATAELMASFYRAMIADGLAPAAALRRAQNALRERPRRAAPFYWAGFVLQGDWTVGASEAPERTRNGPRP